MELVELERGMGMGNARVARRAARHVYTVVAGVSFCVIFSYAVVLAWNGAVLIKLVIWSVKEAGHAIDGMILSFSSRHQVYPVGLTWL